MIITSQTFYLRLPHNLKPHGFTCTSSKVLSEHILQSVFSTHHLHAKCKCPAVAFIIAYPVFQSNIYIFKKIQIYAKLQRTNFSVATSKLESLEEKSTDFPTAEENI